MNPEAFELLRALADGRPLDIARFAERQGTVPASVRETGEVLQRAGLPVRARSTNGLQLAWPVELLDGRAIADSLPDGMIGVEVFDGIDSTNRYLAGQFGHRLAVLAEYQWRGRGRRGRTWRSPPACGLHLSFGYRFESALSALGPLSLVAGIAAVETVRELGVEAGLKWPNDLVVGSRKLGGVLAEVRGSGGGPCQAVLGVGINSRLPRKDETRYAVLPDQPWTDLQAEMKRAPDRNRLAGGVITALDRACREFGSAGFEPFRGRWDALDMLAGREVRALRADGRSVEGRACGVTRTGALKIESAGAMIKLDAGEVSVRAA